LTAKEKDTFKSNSTANRTLKNVSNSIFEL